MVQTAEEKATYKKKWRLEHLDYYRDYNREWNKRNPEKRVEYERRRRGTRDRTEYVLKTKARIRETCRLSAFRRYWKARKEAILALGGECMLCEFDDIRALEIHHKLGGGGQERKLYGNGVPLNNYQYYQGILNHLGELELLCSNCHSIVNWNERHPSATKMSKEELLAFEGEYPQDGRKYPRR